MPAALRDHPMLVHVQGSLLADVSAAVLPADMPISARVGSLVVGFIGLLLLHKIASICAVNVGCRTTAEVARLEEDRLIMSCYEKGLHLSRLRVVAAESGAIERLRAVCRDPLQRDEVPQLVEHERCAVQR